MTLEWIAIHVVADAGVDNVRLVLNLCHFNKNEITKNFATTSVTTKKEPLKIPGLTGKRVYLGLRIGMTWLMIKQRFLQS